MTDTRQTGADIFGADAVLFETEEDAGCISETDDSPAPGNRLSVGAWDDDDIGFISQDENGNQIAVSMPSSDARILAQAILDALSE